MPEPLAVLIVRGVTAYMMCGVVLAAAVLLRNVGRLDPGLQEASYGVRVLIAPGLVALWPLFAWRRLKACQTPVERNAHPSAAARRSACPDAATARPDEAAP